MTKKNKQKRWPLAADDHQRYNFWDCVLDTLAKTLSLQMLALVPLVMNIAGLLGSGLLKITIKLYGKKVMKTNYLYIKAPVSDNRRPFI